MLGHHIITEAAYDRRVFGKRVLRGGKTNGRLSGQMGSYGRS